MNKIKVVTICGSMKFKHEMQDIAYNLEVSKGYAVIQCVYGNSDNEVITSIDKDLISKIHFKKIEISDAIYVVNPNGYVGESTKKEIEFAKKLNKEIMSLEPLN